MLIGIMILWGFVSYMFITVCAIEYNRRKERRKNK